MKSEIQFGKNWVKVNDSVFYVSPQIVRAIKHTAETLAKENLEPGPEEVELYAKALSLVNYPALTDGASPPRGEDFLLLRETSIPLHPQRRFHRTEPFCNAPCGRGVTEGSLSTGLRSPSPEGTDPALTAKV